MFKGELGGIKVGLGYPVRIMGVLNISPESFYKGSIVKDVNDALEKAYKMVEYGVDIIDVGGMSTAPYKETYVSEDIEIERVKPVIKELSKNINKPISIDTRRSKVAEEALKAGASIVNDTSGFKYDVNMLKVIKEYDSSAIAMAYGDTDLKYDPIINIRRLLKESLELAYKNDLNLDKIVIDPGIGFFRDTGTPWYEWDTYVIKNLYRLRVLKKPILIGISRKSFIGKILNIEDPEERLYGSLACEAAAILNGADVIRTHNVPESKQVAKIMEFIRRGFGKAKKYRGVEAIDLTDLWIEDDLKEMFIDLNVDPGGADIMAKKGIFKLIYLRNIPRLLALVIKQEMLSTGGDVATPKDTLLGGYKNTDVIIIGSKSNLKRLIEKLNMMHFESLKKKGMIDSDELANLLEDLADDL